MWWVPVICHFQLGPAVVIVKAVFYQVKESSLTLLVYWIFLSWKCDIPRQIFFYIYLGDYGFFPLILWCIDWFPYVVTFPFWENSYLVMIYSQLTTEFSLCICNCLYILCILLYVYFIGILVYRLFFPMVFLSSFGIRLMLALKNELELYFLAEFEDLCYLFFI
jgi:hypothetical protein